NASGTDQGAGWMSRIDTQPGTGGSAIPRAKPPQEVSSPTVTPAIAPPAVSRDHQMPSTSRGQNVEAATVNPQVTSVLASKDTAGSANRSTTIAAPTTVIRSCRSPPGTRSWEMAPATTSSRPSDVARNAANAPAVSRPVNTPPSGPGSTCAGRATTALSVAPERYRWGTSTRPSVP